MLAFLLLGETPTPLEIFGATLIFVGIVLTLRGHANVAPNRMENAKLR